jgi:hypothetical protein
MSKLYNDLFRHEYWNVGCVLNPIRSFLNPGFRPVIKWFYPADSGKFLADPFVEVRDGATYLLCEEFDYKLRKGRIVSFEVNRDNVASTPEVVMDLPFHVSYPYLLKYDDAFYCIPETARAHEISLYKAEDFPRDWRKITTLVKNFSGIDATVFQCGQFWWLTCTDRDNGPDEKLHVWYADGLFGPWKPHRGNPVKIDKGSTRPAGTPFQYDGVLYRPAQDSSVTYGGRIIINRLVKLTRSEFQEEPVAIVSPHSEWPYPDGTHTISCTSNITAIDGKRWRFITSEFKRSLNPRHVYARLCGR